MYRLLGYTDRWSVQPGQTIAFKVSSELAGKYQARLLRVRNGDSNPKGPGIRTTPVAAAFEGEYPARFQETHAGSYVRIDDASPFQLESFTLQAFLLPTMVGDRPHAIMGNWDDDQGAGYGLILDGQGAVALLLGDGAGGRVQISTGVPVLKHNWTFVSARFDAASGTATVSQQPLAAFAGGLGAGSVEEIMSIRPAGGGDFLLAAWNGAGKAAAGHYDGCIDTPRVASRALEEFECETLHDRVPLSLAGDIVAAWDFSRDIPTAKVSDISVHRRHGRIVNLPTRAQKGWRWNDTEYDWKKQPSHYSAIHFHRHDLYDCGWETDFDYAVPDDLKSGVYAVELMQGDERDTIVFFVRPKRGTRQSDLAYLIPTASYLAYSNHHMITDWGFGENVSTNFLVLGAQEQFLETHWQYGQSNYDSHEDGSPVYFVSRLRPIVHMRLDSDIWEFNADLHITDWFEEKEIPYDIITDEDLHEEGVRLLADYRCVVTGTHPEYYSREMLDAVEAYKAKGGRFLYTGANGFYWRVAFSDAFPGAMEMRRAEDGMRGCYSEGGDYYMQFTGELGGLWRRMGHAPQKVAGTGFTAQGFDRAEPYRRTEASEDPRAAFIFEGIGREEPIGNFGLVGGGAAGWEIDRVDFALGTPPHTLVVALADNFSHAYHWVKEEFNHTQSAINGETQKMVRCDMVFFECPNGGAVFSTSSISWGGSLSHNGYKNNVSQIMENVVRRFLDPTPFPPPGG
ncbi:MAG: N,N-dimethylformamidase beta subunit family domain-containing protein [Dongiaceae bacterium]